MCCDSSFLSLQLKPSLSFFNFLFVSDSGLNSSMSWSFFKLSFLSRLSASYPRPRDTWFFFHMTIWYYVYIWWATSFYSTFLLVHRPESRPEAIDVLYMYCDCIAVLNISSVFFIALLTLIYAFCDVWMRGIKNVPFVSCSFHSNT